MSLFFHRSSASPRRRRAWKLFMFLRWSFMLLVAYGTLQLVIWNRTYDPRFYHFLSTPPGRTLARVMNWPSFYNLPPHDKPESEFSEAELAWKRTLERKLQESWPSHRLVTRSGEEHLVRILQENQHNLTIEESFGGRGRAVRALSRANLLELEPILQDPPHVTWRDVRFQMEFPDFQLFHFGPYTVLTDAPFYEVAESIRELESLHQQFMDLLGDLARSRDPVHSLQVLFFSDEKRFRNYQRDSAPTLSTSAGFYSPHHDRMVVYNQYHSQHAREMREQIEAEIHQMLERAETSQERRAIQDMRSSVRKQLVERGQRETIATIRHEGAHHLSYTYGVHSWFHAENGWLIEGLAVLFEANPPTDLPRSHLHSLKQLLASGRLLPLSDLLNVRKPDEFNKELTDFDTYEAYAFAWSLVHFCMQPENRQNFFRYLRHIRDPDNLRELVRTPRVEILARKLNRTPQQLEDDWRSYMRNL